MLCTPTDHVFDLYKAHQGARLLPSTVACGCVDGLPAVQESASLAPDGAVVVTLCNPSDHSAQTVRTRLVDCALSVERADVLTGDIHDHNDFDAPEAVAPRAFEGVDVAHSEGDTVLTYTLPACSVARLILR